MPNRQPPKGPEVRTPARNIVITDDDWEWLGDWAASQGLDRGSVVRRLITLLRDSGPMRLPTGRVSKTAIRSRVVASEDPVAQRRLDNLRNRS